MFLASRRWRCRPRLLKFPILLLVLDAQNVLLVFNVPPTERR